MNADPNAAARQAAQARQAVLRDLTRHAEAENLLLAHAFLMEVAARLDGRPVQAEPLPG